MPTPKNQNTPQRRRARQRALQCLYAIEQGAHSIATALDDPLMAQGGGASNNEFIRTLVTKAVENKDALDACIRQQSENWDLERLALTDRLILRLALCEFLYFPDIAPKVTINEALEISKNFSTENSSRFINGLLDAILQDLTGSGKLFKVGRGAAETS